MATENVEVKTNSPLMLTKVIIPGVIILLLVTGALWFLNGRLNVSFKNLADTEVKSTIQSVNDRIQIAIKANETVHDYFVSKDSVSSKEFADFASPLVTAAGQQGIDITLQWIDGNNSITYIEPMNEANSKVVGQDLNKFPNRLIPINQAKAKKASMVTAPLFLGQGYPGIIVYTPIFKGDVYGGSAVCVIRLYNLISPKTAVLYERNMHFRSMSKDLIMPIEHEGLIYALKEDGSVIMNPVGETKKEAWAVGYIDTAEDVKVDMDFPDQKWQLHYYPQDYTGELKKKMMTSAVIGYGIGLVLIGLLFVSYKKGKQS
jgi:sensor domain CHASE-containing protein